MYTLEPRWSYRHWFFFSLFSTCVRVFRYIHFGAKMILLSIYFFHFFYVRACVWVNMYTSEPRWFYCPLGFPPLFYVCACVCVNIYMSESRRPCCRHHLRRPKFSFCVFLCVCLFSCICMRICIHVRNFLRVSSHACLCCFMTSCILAHIYIYIYIYIYVYIYICAYI